MMEIMDVIELLLGAWSDPNARGIALAEYAERWASERDLKTWSQDPPWARRTST